jgi:hypothetical protein
MRPFINLWGVVCSMIVMLRFWYPSFGCFGYKILQSRKLPQSILLVYFIMYILYYDCQIYDLGMRVSL